MSPILFLFLTFLPFALGEWELENTLGFFSQTREMKIISSENVSVLCLETKILSGNSEEYGDAFSAAETTINNIKTNNVFNLEKENKNVKRVIKDLDSLAFQLSGINLDIQGLREYEGDASGFEGKRCDITHSVPAPPLLERIKYLTSAIENSWDAVKTDAQKNNPDASEKTDVLETVGVDSRIFLNGLSPIYETLEDIYGIHESFLQGEISEQMAVYIDVSVAELRRAKHDIMSLLGCEMGEKGFFCEIEVIQRESGEEGYLIEPVPFKYEDEIYSINLRGITDKTGTFFAPYCDMSQFHGTCLKKTLYN